MSTKYCESSAKPGIVGVCAAKDIYKGELIEVCPVDSVKDEIVSTSGKCADVATHTNSSVEFTFNINETKIKMEALKDIKRGEELTTNNRIVNSCPDDITSFYN